MSGRPPEGAPEPPGPCADGFAAVIDLTRAMLSAARRAEWDEVSLIEAARGDVLAACFAGADGVRDASAIADGVRALRALDAQIMLLATEAMADLRDKMCVLRTGRRALQAYQSAGAG